MNDPAPTDIKVVDETEQSRYRLFVDGQKAGHETYVLSGETMTLIHTIVYDDFQGRGLAAPLVAAVLDDIRRRGLHLAVECPYVERFLDKHAEQYADLIAPTP